MEIVVASVMAFSGLLKFQFTTTNPNGLLNGCFKVVAYSRGIAYPHEYCLEQNGSDCNITHTDLGGKSPNIEYFNILECNEKQIRFDATRSDGHYTKGSFFTANNVVKYVSESQPAVNVTVTRLN